MLYLNFDLQLDLAEFQASPNTTYNPVLEQLSKLSIHIS